MRVMASRWLEDVVEGALLAVILLVILGATAFLVGLL